MHRGQVCIWFDNLRRYRSGVAPHSPDLALNCSAVAVLHTTALPAYPGLPELAEIEARVPKVADDIFRTHRALFDRIDVANQGIQRVWVRAPLDTARKNVRSLNWRSFFLSELRCGEHKELLQLVVDSSCVQHRTRHCVPLLVDMKIHFALLKLCYGAAYVPWNVPQLLLGFHLVYGVWHSYKYGVELIYRAFLPLIMFLEQGNSLQVGSRGLILVGTRPQRGGGHPPPLSTDPKIVARNSVLCRCRRRRSFCFRHTAGGNFFVRPHVSILKILRILWRIQKWPKSTKR